MKPSEITQANTLGDYAYLAIAQHLEKILNHEEDVLKDRDVEALHQMRVGMRRLRSAIAGFSIALDLPKSAQEKKIAKVARTLGELRDLDVLKEALKKQYQPLLPQPEQKPLKKVLDYLGKQRKHSLEQVQETLTDKTYQNIKKSLQEWLQEPTYQEAANVPIRDILPELLLPSICQLFLHPAWWIGSQNETSQGDLERDTVEHQVVKQAAQLHSLRKQVKRSRYQMELFTDFYNFEYAFFLEDLKEMQKILGQIQDCFVLGEFLTEALNSKSTDRLPSLLEQLQQTRHEAWQGWQPLKQKYLDPQNRQAFHLTLLKPVGENP